MRSLASSLLLVNVAPENARRRPETQNSLIFYNERRGADGNKENEKENNAVRGPWPSIYPRTRIR